MKYLLLISSFVVFCFSNHAFGQEPPIMQNDILGKWTSILQSPEGFSIESPCENQEIILSKKFIVFAYQYEKHDSLFVHDIRQLTKGAVLMIVSAPKLDTVAIKLSWFDRKRDILNFQFTDQKDPGLTGFKQLICRNVKEKEFILASEPCPDLKGTEHIIITD